MYFTSSQKDIGLFHALLRDAPGDGITIGVTSGCFDVIHPLHIQYLQKCASKCDILIVGVDSDSLLFQNKQKMPVICEYDRAFIVSSLECVSQTFIMDTLDDLYEALRILVKRTHESNSVIQLYKATTEYYGKPVIQVPGVQIVSIPDVYPASSTTELVKYIQNNYQKL